MVRLFDDVDFWPKRSNLPQYKDVALVDALKGLNKSYKQKIYLMLLPIYPKRAG
jgi:hypothetical protein